MRGPCAAVKELREKYILAHGKCVFWSFTGLAKAHDTSEPRGM